MGAKVSADNSNQLQNDGYYSRPLDPNIYGSAFGSAPTASTSDQHSVPLSHYPPSAPPPSYPAAVQQQPLSVDPNNPQNAAHFNAAGGQMHMISQDPNQQAAMLQGAQLMAQNPHLAQAIAQNPQLQQMWMQQVTNPAAFDMNAFMAAASQSIPNRVLLSMTPNPTQVKCDFCQNTVTTTTTKVAGGRAYFTACIWITFICCIGMILTAIFWNLLKDTVHTCPNCQKELGRFVPRTGRRGGRRRRGYGHRRRAGRRGRR